MNKPKQLIFPFQINQKASFDSFFCSPDNQNLMTRLTDIVSSQDTSELIIYGEEGSGKSFLMQAVCNELSSAEKQFAFIPMKKAFNMGMKANCFSAELSSLQIACIKKDFPEPSSPWMINSLVSGLDTISASLVIRF